jgi:alpha-beta hydrolase superfamily lysophospholipase
VLILPGLGNSATDYADLADRLRARGLAVAVAPIARLDWGRNAAAITDGNWWRGTLKPRPAVDWYLTRANAAMDGLKREVEGAPVTLLTHSAGGWLGRVFLKVRRRRRPWRGCGCGEAGPACRGWPGGVCG